jgi:nitrite reductase (cytochrome c-552)
MTDEKTEEKTDENRGSTKQIIAFVTLALVVAIAAGAVTALLVNIFERQQEERRPYTIVAPVDEDTVDPAVWGANWPRQYEAYLRTGTVTRTKYGGASLSEGNLPPQKAEAHPWLVQMFAGYAFEIDYRERRGHAYMLDDQLATRRVLEREQPGACLHCHSSVMPLYRELGREAAPDASPAEQIQTGFELSSTMPYWEAYHRLEELDSAHPVSCVDCHDPRNMALRVTRPGFINGIRELKAAEGITDYDPNRDATRQEMRSYVCAQCHVEYYCGPKDTLFFPWGKGLKVEEMEAYFDERTFPDGEPFHDWIHRETGAPLYKAQHPEFEMWSQGIHARSGVSCADCHMPYKREGAMKVTEHWVRSPLLMINRSCQTCHPYPEDEILARVETIQDRHFHLMDRAGVALVDMIDAIVAAREAGASPDQLRPLQDLHRQSQWRLDFVAAENSMGFHAPHEAARILGESIDLSRQAQVQALALTGGVMPARRTERETPDEPAPEPDEPDSEPDEPQP